MTMPYDSREIVSLRGLHVECLRYLFSAETQVHRVLDRIRECVSSQELTQLFADHRGETEEHLNRLNWMFVEMDISREGWHSNGMQGLIDDLEALPVFIKNDAV